jgi:hypothetical protein
MEPEVFALLRDSFRSASPSKRVVLFRRSLPLLLLLWCGLIPLFHQPTAFAGTDAGVAIEPRATIQAIADDFRARLKISGEVVVTIVPQNDRLVSVGRSRENPTAFILSFEESFLRMLDEEELRAVVAHEMGHVWISHNHPFLQTEALANRKAEELVSRESLERVYEKVWLHKGERGDLDRLLEAPFVPAEVR